MSQYSNFDPIIENVRGPTLKAMLKYKKAFWLPDLNVKGMVFYF